MIKATVRLNILDRSTHLSYLDHHTSWCTCLRCPIESLAHTHVQGRGILPAPIVFIGEAPGRLEDKVGSAFVGPSGQLLDTAIDKLGLTVPFFIMNTVMCRPTDKAGSPNRKPSTTEQEACSPRAFELLQLCKPLVAVLLGNVAQGWFYTHQPALNMVDIRIPHLINAYHPSYILRLGGMRSKQFGTWVESMCSELARASLLRGAC